MEMIADVLLIATAMTAGLYCLALNRRLGRLSDAGKGIGPQVDALNEALSKTRTALDETREGVLEMRSSAKTAVAELARGAERADATAQRIDRSVAEAKATIQQLYKAADRIEAHENGPAPGSAVKDDQLDVHAVKTDMNDAPIGEPETELGETSVISVNEEIGSFDDVAVAGGTTGPTIVLPEGNAEPPEPSAATATDGSHARAKSVLKADRVIL